MGRLTFISLFFFVVIHGEKMLVLSKDFDVYWRDYKGTIPADAFPTGHDIFIAQMVAHNGNHCGNVATMDVATCATMPVSEVETRKVESTTNLKVLCTKNPGALKWEYVNVRQLTGKTLENCVTGGFEIGSPLYIGKVFHEGEWKIGKVFPPNSPHKGLRIWWNGGDGYFPTDFQVLMGV